MNPIGRVYTRTHNLDLGWNEIGAAGAKALGPHLTHLRSILKLDLRGNHIGSAGASRWHPTGPSWIQSGNLTSAATQLVLLGPSCWDPAWYSSRAIQQLEMSSNHIGDDGAESLRAHLAHLTSMKHLDLRRNRMSEDVRAALRTDLALLTSLNFEL